MRASIVIPTLNEADRVEQTLRHTSQVWPDAELIVADGGSTDGTQHRARVLARVVECAPGRAGQMNDGAAVASGDALLFLHADSRLPETARSDVLAAVTSGAESGIFRLRFDQRGVLLGAFAFATRLPWSWIAFGDRAMWVTREVFEQLGGFKPLPLFEDADLARRLAARGGFRYLSAPVTTSARRFDRHGAFRQQVRNTALWTAWVLGVPPSRLRSFYPYDR